MSPEESGAIAELIPNLRRYARVLVRDADQADDLVQDCLERAITRYHCFTPGTNLRSWLFTILLNLVRSQARTNKRRGTMVNIDEVHDAPAHVTPPEQPLMIRDLQAAFEKLPEIIKLAAEIGCPSCTAEVHGGSDERPYHENFELHRSRLQRIVAVLQGTEIRLGLGLQGTAAARKPKAFEFIHDLEALSVLVGTIASPQVGIDLVHVPLPGVSLPRLAT